MRYAKITVIQRCGKIVLFRLLDMRKNFLKCLQKQNFNSLILEFFYV